MSLAVWLALLPLRLLAALGLRRSLILACLFVLAVTAYGVAEELGLLDPPAAATPAQPARQAGPSAAAGADIPPRLLASLPASSLALPRVVLERTGRHRQGRVRPRAQPPPRRSLRLERRGGGGADAVRHRGRAGR